MNSKFQLNPESLAHSFISKHYINVCMNTIFQSYVIVIFKIFNTLLVRIQITLTIISLLLNKYLIHLCSSKLALNPNFISEYLYKLFRFCTEPNFGKFS